MPSFTLYALYISAIAIFYYLIKSSKKNVFYGTIFRTKNIETRHCPTCKWQFEHSNLVLGTLEPTCVIKGSTKHNSGRNSAATTAESFFFPLHTKDTGTSIPRRYSRSWPRAAPSLSALLEAAHWTNHGTGQSIFRARPRFVPFFSPYSLLKRTRLIFDNHYTSRPRAFRAAG